jgi:membrane fusion protein (multidrug efflux system)
MLETGYTRTTIAVQEAMVKEAETKVELARARLAECIIAAPFAGTITRVYVRPGDMAAMKTPLLEMVDLSSMVIRVAVTEAQAGDVREGTPAVVQLDALHGKTFHGKVVRAYPELDRRMRTRTVELVLDEQADLVPGMFARVKLILNSMADALVVPREAVVTTPAGAHIVFVVEEGMAVQRKVNTGIEEGDRVQILSGLCAGEKAIVKGHEKIKDGAAVRVPESGKAPGKDSPPSQSVPSGAPAKGENK